MKNTMLVDAVLEVTCEEEKEALGEILELIEGSDIETYEDIRNLVLHYLGVRCGELSPEQTIQEIIGFTEKNHV